MDGLIGDDFVGMISDLSETGLDGIEALFKSAVDCPMGSGGAVVDRGEGLAGVGELDELGEIDPGVPGAVDLEAVDAGEDEAAGVLVLAGDLVVGGEELLELLDRSEEHTSELQSQF